MNGATTSTQLCFNSAGVAVGTGNKNSVEAYFDTRFDILKPLSGNPSWSADNAPSVNVRKGYVPGEQGNNDDWCKIGNAGQSASGANGDPPSATNTYYTYPADITTATTTNNSKSVTSIPSSGQTGLFRASRLSPAARSPPELKTPSPLTLAAGEPAQPRSRPTPTQARPTARSTSNG